MLYERINNCRICRGEIEKVFDLGELHLTGTFPMPDEEVPSGPFSIHQCNTCGLVQSGQNYNLGLMYGDNYGYRSSLNKGMVNHLAEIAAYASTFITLTDNDKVLDIGSNDGTLLHYIPYGKKVGIDPVAYKFKEWYDDDVEVIPEFFSSIYVSDKKFKLITSIAMFYDLPDPIHTAREISSHLTDDGIWICEVAHLPTQIENNAFDGFCQEHLEYYTISDMLTIADLSGLTLIDVNFNNTNGGSMLCVFAKWGPEVSLPEEIPIDWDKFKEDIAWQGDRLHDLLNTKSVIHGYGASTKGNVLLQYYGITNKQVQAIAEVNEDKFGCVTPGTNIPIISEMESEMCAPDFYLVLPWHFKRGILNREKGTGKKFIFPLPQVEVHVA